MFFVSFVFLKFKCFLCRSDEEYDTIELLHDHVVNEHCLVKEIGERLVLCCPKTMENCLWHKYQTKEPREQETMMKLLAHLLNHLITVHCMQIPDFVQLCSCDFP